MVELREGTCYPKALMGVNVGLASIDAVIALLAFAQVLFFSVFSMFLIVPEGYMYVGFLLNLLS